MSFSPKSRFLQEGLRRGLIAQCTNMEGLDDLLMSGPQSAYLGFDPTAISLHAGHLVPLALMRLWIECGNKAVALVGGGTALVGDPSGRSSARPMLTQEKAQEQTLALQHQISFLLDGKAVMVNNKDWLENISLLDFLRDTGARLTVSRMLGMETAKARLEGGLSLLEFTYGAIQGSDFTTLHERENVRVQFGGSDQWGNIVLGVELGRKKGLPELFGATIPLLTVSDGRKMGKSANGALWLDGNLTSDFDFWQWWRNLPDADIVSMLVKFGIEDAQSANAMFSLNPNDAKKHLAGRMTAWVRGNEASVRAQDTARDVFENNTISENLPLVMVPVGMIHLGDVIEHGNFGFSKKAIKRLLEQGGIRLDQEKITSPHHIVSFDGQDRLLSIGKTIKVRIKSA